MTVRSVFWRGLQWPSLEHLSLEERADGSLADALILGAYEGRPFRVRYQVTVDDQWTAQSLVFEEELSRARLELFRTDGGWRHEDGRSVPEVGDAADVDIAATPFTNTLPIRRLGLEPGRSAEITVLYLSVFPEVTVSAARQRYTRLLDGRYRYESMDSGFTVDLHVDSEGLVLDYPGIWERVPS